MRLKANLQRAELIHARFIVPSATLGVGDNVVLITCGRILFDVAGRRGVRRGHFVFGFTAMIGSPTAVASRTFIRRRSHGAEAGPSAEGKSLYGEPSACEASVSSGAARAAGSQGSTGSARCGASAGRQRRQCATRPPGTAKEPAISYGLITSQKLEHDCDRVLEPKWDYA